MTKNTSRIITSRRCYADNLNVITRLIDVSFCRAVESSFFKKQKTSKRFVLFCLYGWGFAAGWTALAIFCQLSTSADIPPILKPDIGQLSCWFSSKYCSVNSIIEISQENRGVKKKLIEERRVE